MDALPISSRKSQELERLMKHYSISESDIVERFIHSSKPGGQNVNKVATCVELKHLPSSTVIKCQSFRTQGANRYQARLLLVEKIKQQIESEKKLKQHIREKRKRQNRKRPQRLKEEILQRKKHRSQTKQRRGKVFPHSDDL